MKRISAVRKVQKMHQYRMGLFGQNSTISAITKSAPPIICIRVIEVGTEKPMVVSSGIHEGFTIKAVQP